MKRTVNVLSKLNWGTRACAVLVLCATTAIALRAQTLTTLYSFCSQTGCPDGDGPHAGLVQATNGDLDGDGPHAGLVQATNGDLYGTTLSGGANCVPDGCGTVFKITPGGTLTVAYSFCSDY